ncbi:MAG TPA: hypothetical protein VIK72_19235 [Clostridiaceae bacterium]
MAKDNGNNSNNGKQMPVSGRGVSGSATGAPTETSVWITGNDLRTGKSGK